MRCTFEFPIALKIGIPFALVLLALMAWRLRRGGVGTVSMAVLVAARTVVMGILIFLAARPVWVSAEREENRRGIVLLCDKSESMSLPEEGGTRYEQMLHFLGDKLAPSLNREHLKTQAFVFGGDAEAATGESLMRVKPDAARTDLGAAIARGLSASTETPLAVIALTDGVANRNESNNAAIAALLEKGVPFIGIGIGRDVEISSISLRNTSAPDTASPKQNFRVSAQLQATTTGGIPECEVLLLRDGKIAQTRKIPATRGSRLWSESFVVKEETEGTHSYTVQLQPPAGDAVKCANRSATSQVRITKESEMRILFVQGQLTWDFKFIGRALSGDPALKVTGLSRTSTKSFFRQNVEGPGELAEGFPTSLDALTPYRVIVVSSLKASDLTGAQQELIARFCRELGGGVLLTGGPATFDGSWQGSKLEQLLPVTFDSGRGVLGLDKPFHVRLTDEAFRSPIFQIGDEAANRAAWDKLPAFTQYGRVIEAKPGAVVWAQHPDDIGPKGRRILMAAQRYGGGIAAVICIENFWRWRLAKDSDPQQFDRFWQQLFRYLGQSGREDISLYFADETLRLQSDVHFVVERQSDADAIKQPDKLTAEYKVSVTDPAGRVVLEQKTELQPRRPVPLSFRADKPGVYIATVLNATGAQVTSRTIDLENVNVEMEKTARDMENLRQWASLTHGVAFRVEDCRSGDELMREIKHAIEAAQTTRRRVTPAGMNPWVLAALLLALGGEWMLRRRWGLR